MFNDKSRICYCIMMLLQTYKGFTSEHHEILVIIFRYEQILFYTTFFNYSSCYLTIATTSF